MSIEVTLLGTGVGIPHSGRSQAGLVVKAKDPLLFDCGAGTLLRLAEAGFGPLDIDVAFLSHLHLDHVSDLLALSKARWLLGVCDMEIFGPSGTEEWFRCCQRLYSYLKDIDIEFHEVEPEEEFNVSGARIATAKAVHSVPALAYRVEYCKKAVVYSGDTEPVSSVANLAMDVDLLIHECSFPEPFKVTNHTTPRRLGEVLGKVDRVVLTHLYPETIGHEEEMVKDVKRGLGPDANVEIGRDLQRIEV